MNLRQATPSTPQMSKRERKAGKLQQVIFIEFSEKLKLKCLIELQPSFQFFHHLFNKTFHLPQEIKFLALKIFQ